MQARAMGPVGTKLLKELRKAARRPVIDLGAFRDARKRVEAQTLDEDEAADTGLSPNHAAWMQAFEALAGIAHALLGTATLRKHALRVEAADEEYMPGGPPSSPILDSVFVTWWMADLGIGPQRESLVSVLAQVGPLLGFPSRLCECASALAQSRMGAYRVTELGTHRVRLEDLATGHVVEAQLPADLKSRARLWLTRVLSPLGSDQGDSVVWTTPYELSGVAAEARWLEYFDRAAGGASPAERAGKLAQHFKAADDSTRWMEFIMNGYFGVTQTGGIVLTGVPDRPQTLPHHPQYDPAVAADPTGTATPLEHLRARLADIAHEHGLMQTAEEDRSIRELLQAPREPLYPEASRIMSLAYAMYGKLNHEACSAVDLLSERADELPPAERAILDGLQAGWFSAFEVVHVRLDEGIEVRDVLRRRKLWITERAATRQIDLGDLLVGWIVVQAERITLEGGVCHVPRMFAGAFELGLREFRKQLQRSDRELDFRKRAGLLAAAAVPLLDLIVSTAPAPTLANTDGEPLLLCTAHYEVSDRARVAVGLGRRFEQDGDSEYRHVAGDTLLASLELTEGKLLVRCNSRRRLEQIKAILRDELGDLLRHRADSHQAPQATWEEMRQKAKSEPPAPPLEVPEETQRQIQGLMLRRMQAWIDEPVPALGGKTPRQAVRSQRGRDDVALMLTRQQQIFEAGANLPVIDLREIWDTLGIHLEPR
jgi:hypothetical protein